MDSKLRSLEQAWPLLRDILLFVVGMALLIHEAFGEARPPVMGIFLVVAGAPLPIRADERRSKNGARK